MQKKIPDSHKNSRNPAAVLRSKTQKQMLAHKDEVNRDKAQGFHRTQVYNAAECTLLN